MASHADVRRLALALSETSEAEGKFAFFVLNKGKPKQFLWLWQERIDPKKARVPNPKVLALRTASLDDKEFLLAAHPERFFTEPHYNGYPAVLLRLETVTARDLRPLILEAWRAMAPKGMEPLVRPMARGRRKVARKKK